MSDPVRRASEWVYEGVWGILARAMLVPRTPPVLPVQPGEELLSLHPAMGYLRYLKFQFWIGVTLIDGTILVAWLFVLIAAPEIGILAAPIALVLAVVPDIVAYVAIHVYYDTIWYVLTRRSLRIRGGVWVLNEMTFTFENVQNVTVNQGPLQRIFGIADVVVETAGGTVIAGAHGAVTKSMHRGVLTGIDNAEAIQSLIRERLGQSRTAGLGDELHAQPHRAPTWGNDHIRALRDIRDTLRAAARRS
jgi:membrane protein YdbS with pleckstrin-like domain